MGQSYLDQGLQIGHSSTRNDLPRKIELDKGVSFISEQVTNRHAAARL